jgi:3-hydroxymyristoyl/3-hydroxydecanoyl-(acyl carrier protein) dehydratase
VDVRFVAPVTPTRRLIYRASEIRRDGTLLRYEVDALVDRTVVARGTLTVAETRR